MWKQQAKTVDRMIEQAKREHYSSQISALNPSDAIGFIKGLMGRNKPTPLPSHDTDIELAMRCNTFFIDKVAGIRDRLTAVDQTLGPCSEVYEVSSALNTFEVIEPAELSKLIMAMKSKSCALDPAPTMLVKKCLGAILSLISYIINSSYIQRSGIQTSFQSAYHVSHSVETALLRVHSDITRAIGSRKCVLLILLDLSAAFDTVDHAILLHRLDLMGIRGTVLSWLWSYLTGRSQYVRIGQVNSAPIQLDCGVM
jgi:hypothetical protein